jgi:hypothetical protein
MQGVTARRRAALGLLGAVLTVAGFQIGRSVGGDPATPELGSTPMTITTGGSNVAVPKYVTKKDLPTLVTTIEVTTAEAEDSGAITESGTAAPIVEEKPEKKAAPPPKSSQPPEPGVTVGGIEE